MNEFKFIKSSKYNNLFKAELIAYTSFLTLNLIIIILLFFILRSTFKKIIFLKYRLMTICIVEAIWRIIYIKAFHAKKKKALIEIILSIKNTFQIYLIIKLIESILNNLNSNDNIKKGKSEKNNIQDHQNNDKISHYLIIASFIINLPFKRFSSFKIFFCLIQNISLLVYSILFYKYINKKINLIISKLTERKLITYNDTYLRLLDIQFPILILFIVIFIFDIIIRLLGNSIIISYSKLIMIAIKESSNILIFLVLYSMIFLLDKINRKKATLSNSSSLTEWKKLINDQ